MSPVENTKMNYFGKRKDDFTSYGTAVKGILINFVFLLILSERKKNRSVNIKRPGKYKLLSMTVVCIYQLCA